MPEPGVSLALAWLQPSLTPALLDQVFSYFLEDFERAVELGAGMRGSDDGPHARFAFRDRGESDSSRQHARFE